MKDKKCRQVKVADVVAVLSAAGVLLLTGQGTAQEYQAEDYNLSMAGALISDWCGRQWREEEFITQHACNYAISQRYDLEISGKHFNECAVANGGDIVKIADCMTASFNDWIVNDRATESTPQQ